MIRTLYLRIAIVIFVVVWCSMALSGFMFSRYYQNQFSDRMEQLQGNAAKLVVRLIQETEPQQLNQAVSIAAQLSRGQRLMLYTENGELYASGTRVNCEVDVPLVERVLQGETFSSFQEEADDDCMRGAIGVPFAYNGVKHALFVLPSAPQLKRPFDNNDIRNVVTVLLISTVIICLAAVYLVRPLKQITQATKRIAAGDFDVQLRIRQKDELGALADSINHMSQELQKMEQMRREFVSNVSHDIQTPLTSIRGFSKLLQDDALDPQERNSYLQLIASESERLSRLSENLLKLAALDANHYPHEPKRYALDEQWRRTVVACEPLWAAKQHTIDLELPADDVWIVADEDSLHQVWYNLLHNAIKFTPEGGSITITVETEAECIVVTVADTGIGIGADEVPHLFQRFYRADASRQQSASSGNGLGLAIVHRIVQRHQGTIEVESERHYGTRIRVTLPAQPE